MDTLGQYPVKNLKYFSCNILSKAGGSNICKTESTHIFDHISLYIEHVLTNSYVLLSIPVIVQDPREDQLNFILTVGQVK